jgi:hypothetical protein
MKRFWIGRERLGLGSLSKPQSGLIRPRGTKVTGRQAETLQADRLLPTVLGGGLKVEGVLRGSGGGSIQFLMYDRR